MRILILSDTHISETTSIITGNGEKYTLNLEQAIKSFNYYNNVAIDKHCEMMIFAGDVFNKSNISDIEITATRDIIWNELPKYFLVGNHESSVNNLKYNTVKILENKNSEIISTQGESLMIGSTQIHFLPYILHSDKKPLETYLIKDEDAKKHIIISHNDIAGIQYGGFISKDGFTLDEIDENCDLFLNGHLHNGGWLSKKALNLGSYSCFNFTNDAFSYKYGGWILDTDTLELEFIENPFAWQFYKIEVKSVEELNKVLTKIKNNAVLSVKCSDVINKDVKDILSKDDRILTYRVISVHDASGATKDGIKELQSVNHIEEFMQCCAENIDDPNNVLESELLEVCK